MLAALLVLLAAAAGARLGDLTRREQGDLFTLLDDVCSAAECAEHGAGASTENGECSCVCPQRAPLFREDRELCVDDLPECSLATFGSGVGVQRIPFVFLPLKGQIIHPSKEIVFQGVKTPICAVSGAQFLTRKGFVDLRNTLDADVPFNLFRDEGRTFLQWSGEEELRARMSGRVMVVRLLCRDVAAAQASPLDLRGVFTPCVAFRVQGTPPRHGTNVTEVQFSPNAQTSEASVASGLSVSEYVAIGISSLLLGLIYVASVFLYLHIRKRRKVGSEESGNRRLKGLKKKDGSVITERDIIRINNERTPTLPNMEQDDGVVKNNPLLTINRQYHDSKAKFTSDSGSNFSDSDEFNDGNGQVEDNYFGTQTSAIVHPCRGKTVFPNENSEQSHRDESGIERLPDEHVSIVETIEDREISRPVGTTRRKLYFNPAYFEPNLMADPPQAALEFLIQIREVIAIAKHKMATKRFLPVLNQIPEEETYSTNENNIYQGLGSQRSGSVISLKRENSRKKTLNCVGCPGCLSEGNHDLQNLIKNDVVSCSNCMHGKGEKQNSIRRWLENIPSAKPNSVETLNVKQNSLINSLLSLPVNESKCKIKKQNSFSATNALYYGDTNLPKKSTMSVRSEPSLRNHNFPLPDFNKIEFFKQHKYYDQTISKVEDIRPIGTRDFQSNSLRTNAIANHRINKFITNKNVLPDMVNEAIALDHSSKFNNANNSDDEILNKSHNNYTLTRTDSPGNDYETDSLERSSQKKGKLTPTDFTDFPSSQASPSLSNALPLEEELTMRNAIYKTHSSSNSNTPSPHREIHISQNHYETIGKASSKTLKPVQTLKQNKDKDYSLVSEVYVNNNYNFGSTPTSPSGSESSIGSRKLLKTTSDGEELPGCLTIEVKDPPENYIKIHESDGFEPDTLDRKHKELKKQKEALENAQFSRKDLLKNIEGESPKTESIQLRSSATFANNNGKVEYIARFNSLRNSYEHKQNGNGMQRGRLSPTMFSGSKSLENISDDTWEDEAVEWATEEGRILTLELRHSKRQRQSTPPTIKQFKNLARPDILPPLPPANEVAIYEHPNFPPRKVEYESTEETNLSKNGNGRSLSPRIIRNIEIEPISSRKLNSSEYYGPSCSPMRASAQSKTSDYDNIVSINPSQGGLKIDTDINRIPGRRRSVKVSGGVNTNTFVRGQRDDGHMKARYRRKKCLNIEDSGYLSSDSTNSRQIQRKIVVAKIVSGSESDDTENEARSESGAESVETHSVYFGSFRNNNVNNSSRDYDNNHK